MIKLESKIQKLPFFFFSLSHIFMAVLVKVYSTVIRV